MAELAIGAHPGLSVAEETRLQFSSWSPGQKALTGVSRYLALYCLLSSVRAPVGADSLEGLCFLFQREAPAFQGSHGLGHWPLSADKLDIGHS